MQREIQFSEIIEAREKGDGTALNEASLGRVWQHVQRSSQQSWAILTSWRSSNTEAENLKNYGELLQLIRSAGLGFFKLRGHWRENINPNVAYEDSKPEDLVDVAEPSLFVPGISRSLAEKVMQRYDQDAIVYAGEDTGGSVQLLHRTGSSEDLGKFTPDTIAQAYSTVKGRNYVFEYVAQGFVENLIESLFIPRKQK